MPFSIESIDTWLFDLDNTLYPPECNLFSQVDWRMTFWISDEMALPKEEARALQKDLFRKHGTTLRGLMTEHGIDPHAFLSYVHDIDYSPVPADGAMTEVLRRLPGRKIIFTNGTVRHAEAVLDRLGARDLFDDIFDIVGADFIPKPDPRPYDQVIDLHGIDPATTIMVEDMAKNLLPAHERGMRTLWVSSGPEWSHPAPDATHIHHRADDLTAYLRTALG
ncbi:MAG: pyrimidine 5'-nucleotidase [Alphaproteobacteria bacterium]|nr:pyrimidine 5'-nucleotidase [Alphaproteobacteria bacterium]